MKSTKLETKLAQFIEEQNKYNEQKERFEAVKQEVLDLMAENNKNKAIFNDTLFLVENTVRYDYSGIDRINTLEKELKSLKRLYVKAYKNNQDNIETFDSDGVLIDQFPEYRINSPHIKVKK